MTPSAESNTDRSTNRSTSVTSTVTVTVTATYPNLQEWNESFGPDAPLLRDAASLGVPLSAGFVGSETGDGEAGETKVQEVIVVLVLIVLGGGVGVDCYLWWWGVVVVIGGGGV